MSSIYVSACISGSTSTLYLKPSSGSLEASSPVNSWSQKLFQTILSDSQVHPHLGPLVYTVTSRNTHMTDADIPASSESRHPPLSHPHDFRDSWNKVPHPNSVVIKP